MTRIAVGAFLHETNTFAATKATHHAFVHGGGRDPAFASSQTASFSFPQSNQE